MAASPAIPRLPRVIGHRGAAGHAPENTLEGLAAAARLGLGWVEFDVALSADGVPVLFHDETLERTTNGGGKLAVHSLAELRQLDAGSWFGAGFAGARVPTLSEAMAALAELGLHANVEIKPTPGRETETGRRVAECLRAAWPAALGPPYLSSFSETALEAAIAAAPELPRGLLVHRIPRDWRARTRRLGCGALHANRSLLSARQAEAVRNEGVGLLAYTVNDASEAQRLYGLGVEAVFSDWPDRLGVLPPAGNVE